MDDPFTVLLCLPTVDHLMKLSHWIRPRAPAWCPLHPSLCHWVAFVVDHCSCSRLSHPNVLITSLFANTVRNMFETLATVGICWQGRSPGRIWFLLPLTFPLEVAPIKYLATYNRLSAANNHHLIHRRPLQRFGEGATAYEGVHRDVARQPYHP